MAQAESGHVLLGLSKASLGKGDSRSIGIVWQRLALALLCAVTQGCSMAEQGYSMAPFSDGTALPILAQAKQWSTPHWHGIAQSCSAAAQHWSARPRIGIA